MKKLRVAIIGTGNIGTDLLIKCIRSSSLNVALFIGRNADSKGLKIASQLGVKTNDKSIDGLIDNIDSIDLIFDSTSAGSHIINYERLKKFNKKIIDLTPSRIGKLCIPAINANECLSESNVNLITCGGQASIPIIYAISKKYDGIEYIEIAATISSDSAGMGTRENLEEYTITTQNAISLFTGVKNVKSILSLNPAVPQIVMRNTIYIKFDTNITQSFSLVVEETVKTLQKYVPGYKVTNGPEIDNQILKLTIEVQGNGDYLPKYSGNLDIITSAAVRMAEIYAEHLGF